jgi:hypothetical protein
VSVASFHEGLLWPSTTGYDPNRGAGDGAEGMRPAGGESDERLPMSPRHDGGVRATGTNELASIAWLPFNIKDWRAFRNSPKRENIACADASFRTDSDFVSDGGTLRNQGQVRFTTL